MEAVMEWVMCLIDILVGARDVLIGVLVAAVLAGCMEWWRAWRSRAKSAYSLAVRVIDVLDEYKEECVAVVQDDGSVPDGPNRRKGSRKLGDHLEYWPVVPDPDVPEFPTDVDWESIDGKLMYAIWAMRDRARQVNKRIQYMKDNYKTGSMEHAELHEVRHKEYAMLGLRAIKATESLREQGGLSEKEAMLTCEGGWDTAKTYKPVDRKDLFEETIKRVKEAGLARSAHNKKEFSGMNEEYARHIAAKEEKGEGEE